MTRRRNPRPTGPVPDEPRLRLREPVDVLAAYLELVLEGVVSHLAMGLPADDLEPVLDLVEESVRRHRRG